MTVSVTLIVLRLQPRALLGRQVPGRSEGFLGLFYVSLSGGTTYRISLRLFEEGCANIFLESFSGNDCGETNNLDKWRTEQNDGHSVKKIPLVVAIILLKNLKLRSFATSL